MTGYIQGQLNKRYANTKGGSLKNIGAHYDIVSERDSQSLLHLDRPANSSHNPIIIIIMTPPVQRHVRALPE